jgi:uncharacterized protein YukE
VSGSKITVVPDDLHLSARFVDGHAQDIQAQHASADARIESAQPGLVGLSAAALAAKAAEWQGVTQALYARLTAHSAAFQTSALGYEATDDRDARAIGAIGMQAVQSFADRP